MPFQIEYRPRTFDDIIGNRDVVESLESLFKQKDFPHSFLFYGMTGCGKTTFARIIANVLNCSEYDVVEINASNNRGIDTVRDIITQMNYKPLSGTYKVYILDEVHQATKDFQNGILKALEDTPAHVIFILCTTDPEKLLKTVKNRCSQFQVSKLNYKAIGRLLDNVTEKIGKKKVSDTILKTISEECEGVPRQALVLLQQVIDIKDEEKALKIIKSTKNEEKNIIDLCRALNEMKAWNVIASIIKAIEAEPETIRRAVLGYFTTVALGAKGKKDALRASMIIENFTENYYDSGKAGLILSCFRSIME